MKVTKGKRMPYKQRHVVLKAAGVAGIMLSTIGGNVQAGEIDLGNPEVRVRWDNTLKYSAAMRAEDRSDKVLGVNSNNNLDDGDQNFDQGDLISNRVDLLSEFDLTYLNRYGIRVSGAGWFDEVYNGSNANGSPTTSNNSSVANNKFTNATRNLHGRKAELLDAFAFGSFDLPGERQVSLRAGRYAQLYGESLFMGANGIAAAQGPIDVVKALSVPNSQFKEIMMPVWQTSAQLRLSDDLTVGGYYQLEWRKNRLPGAGSYFSNGDILDDGGELLYIPGAVAGGTRFHRAAEDFEARNSGQGGLQVRWNATPDLDLGFYAARFHDKSPKVYLRAGVNALGGGDIGDYLLAYPEDINVMGASFATNVGLTNVSGEMSVRTNQPLATENGDVLTATAASNNSDSSLYAKGTTYHANLSGIALGNKGALWDGYSLVGEVAYNRLISHENKDRALDHKATRDAAALRVSFEPNYFQVLPGLDLTAPIGLGYGLFGRSALGPTVFSPAQTGDVSFGLKGVYQNTWNVSLGFTHFFGNAGQLTQASSRFYSYDQYFADRDFVSFSVQRSF